MSLEPLEKMAGDVKEGDLVRIFLERSDYVGYKWAAHIVGYKLSAHIINQLMLPEDSDVIFCSLNPNGVTRRKNEHIAITVGNRTTYRQGPAVADKIQFVGVNLKTQMLGNEHIRGYEVIERTKSQE